jgi:hypothetical protein
MREPMTNLGTRRGKHPARGHTVAAQLLLLLPPSLLLLLLLLRLVFVVF